MSVLRQRAAASSSEVSLHSPAASSAPDWLDSVIVGDCVAALERLPKAYGPLQVYLTPRLDALLRSAQDEAERMHDEFVSTEHLLLAALADKERTGEILRRLGLTRPFCPDP